MIIIYLKFLLIVLFALCYPSLPMDQFDMISSKQSDLTFLFKDDHDQIRTLTKNQLKELKKISAVINDIVDEDFAQKKACIPMYSLDANSFDQLLFCIDRVEQLKTAQEKEQTRLKSRVAININLLSFIKKLKALKASDFLIVPSLKDSLLKNIAQSAQTPEQLEMFINNHQEWQAQYGDIIHNHCLQKNISQAALQQHYPALLGSLNIAYTDLDASSTILSMAWNPDGTKLAAGSSSHIIYIWDSTTWKLLKIIRDPSGPVYSVKWSSHGTKLIGASRDNIIRIWDSNSWRLLKEMVGHNGKIDIAYSAGLIKFACASTDNSIGIFDRIKEKRLNTLRGHTKDVKSLDWNRDNTKIVSGSYDRTIRIWDSDTAQQLKIIKDHVGLVFSVIWSPDGTKLASAAWNSSIRIWDIAPLIQLINDLKEVNLKQAIFIITVFSGKKWIYDNDMFTIFKTLPESIKNNIQNYSILTKCLLALINIKNAIFLNCFAQCK